LESARGKDGAEVQMGRAAMAYPAEIIIAGMEGVFAFAFAFATATCRFTFEGGCEEG